MARILVVDDEQGMVAVLKANLGRHGHEVTGAGGGGEALAAFRREPFDLVITDLRMEPLDGFAVLEGVRADSPGTPVIVLTGHGDVPDAVRALRGGAHGFLQKPCDFEALAALVTKALGEADLARENRALRRAVASLAGGARLVGESAAVRGLRALIGKVAATEATVLIRGESGVGKELVARALHDDSARAGGPFIAVNCAAIAEPRPQGLRDQKTTGLHAAGQLCTALDHSLGLRLVSSPRPYPRRSPAQFPRHNALTQRRFPGSV